MQGWLKNHCLSESLCAYRTGELWAAIAELRNSLDAREMEGKHQDQWLKQRYSELEKINSKKWLLTADFFQF